MLIVGKGGNIVIKTNKQQYVQTRKTFKVSTLADRTLIIQLYILFYIPNCESLLLLTRNRIKFTFLSVSL